MLAFLQQIVNSISVVMQLIIMVITSIYNWIVVIPSFMTYTLSVFSWLPQPFAMFAIACLGISLMLFILGRDT